MKKDRKILLFAILLICSVFFAACSNTEETSKKDSSNEDTSIGDFPTISIDDLQNNIGKEDWVIVDTRSNDAFNGWALEGEKRGGHIKGAVDFSAAWLDVVIDSEGEQLLDLLATKGMTKERNIVLYDANGKDAKTVANYLQEQGFENLAIFDVKEWAANEELAMESYPNYEMLVPPSWINDTIENNNDGKPYKIFEVSWGEESEDYKNGHIPGAVHINTDEVEEGPVWNRLSDAELEAFALNNGITSNTTVILYGADSMAAYRVGVILKYMGTDDVRVLNGGWAAWSNAGYEIETKGNEKEAVDSFGVLVPANPDYIIDLEEAKQVVTNRKNSTLVDIRSRAEFIGETSGYNYIEPKGRPQGSVWGRAGSDSSHLEDYRNPDDTMRNASQIYDMWAEEGIDPSNHLAFYCGTGWRAAEVLFYADVMGLENITLYDGGWNEWSMDSSNPIETGEPADL
ncbi:rhodanese-like domain-containing protein [Bacillus sp. B15-48]|uniref:rhodanese-like domain-containing protein n=1 Tax=Bacillus sp. B15-48 TaxID=1548601 RepID=UPI00194009F0|nr:rhodanese-like domain-containing protein [Bacillus sp. B15-48]MBM4765158.1 thiosulfate sulfurtransferase [Bacillus sp. B15-48]